MRESTICTNERNEKPNIDRRERFVPGVVYRKIINSRSTGLRQRKLKRLMQGSTKCTKDSVKS